MLEVELLISAAMRGNYRPKYGIPTMFKLILYFFLNFAAFYRPFRPYRWELVVSELLLLALMRGNSNYLLGFLEFLFLNFIGLYFLFYLAYWSWCRAFVEFLDYLLTILVLSLGSFIFLEITPMRELIIALHRLHLPPRFIFALAVLLQFLPLLVKKLHEIVIYQKARGYRVGIFHLSPVIVPALLHTIDFSLNLSLSLKSRGFEI